MAGGRPGAREIVVYLPGPAGWLVRSLHGIFFVDLCFFLLASFISVLYIWVVVVGKRKTYWIGGVAVG